MVDARERTVIIAVLALVLMAPIAGLAPTALADQTVPPDGPTVTRLQVQDSVIKGLDWFASTQNFDGSWSGSVGITGFVVMCFTGAGYDYTNRTVQNALGHLRNFYHPVDGSMADTFLNYDTAISLMALSGAGDPEDADRLPKMAKFLERLQFSDDSIYNKTEQWFQGGWPNTAGIPDVSNSQFALLALTTAQLLVEDYTVLDSVWSNSSAFTNICQNWPDVNDLPWAHNITLPSHGDGGFVYNGYRSRTPLGEEFFESYGSITAAGYFAYLVTGNDGRQPEVAAARAWMDFEHNMEINPKMVGKGLYYYLWTQTRALAMSPQDWVVDGAGKLHDWRAEVADLFMGLQRSNGAWPGNPQIGWREEEPEIAGIYAILSMQAAYIMAPNPELTITVYGPPGTGVDEEPVSAVFIDMEGKLLVTDESKGLRITDQSMICSDPEMFRKIWIRAENSVSIPGSIVITGKWGDDRISTIGYPLANGFTNVHVSTGGFAGPFGIHASVLDDPPEYEIDKRKVELVRGETEIIDFELTETTGAGPITRAMLITHAGEGIVADVDVQGIDVLAGDVDVLRLTISVAADVKAGDDWYLVVTSSTAPPQVISVELVEAPDDEVTISVWYWLIVVILVVLVFFFILLPRVARRDDGSEEVDMEGPAPETVPDPEPEGET